MASTFQLDETEFAGGMTVRFCTLSISDYAAGGETLTPSMIGMNRFQSVFADVADGTGAVAQYDATVDAVKLFRQANDGTGTANDALVEAPGASAVAAEVNLVIVGK